MDGSARHPLVRNLSVLNRQSWSVADPAGQAPESAGDRNRQGHERRGFESPSSPHPRRL